MTKKLIKHRSIILLSLILIIFSGCSRDGFRGVVEYNITYPGSRIDYATQDALPTNVAVSVNNNLVRKEMRGGELIQTQISDAEEESVSILLEIMGNKYQVQRTKSDIQAALREMPDPEFDFTGETKEILGYNCQKVIAKTYDEFGEETVAEIYFTSDIPGFPFNFDLPYREIPGLMLVYELRTGDINMRFEAQNIRTRRSSTKRRNFRIPSDYQQITHEELRRKLE